MRDPDLPVREPYPYKTKPYGAIEALFDSVTHRFNENTKIITVEGPPTGNKNALCKALADAFDMHYIPSPHLDSFYTDDYGRNKRLINYKLPPKMRSYDLHQFMERPYNFLTGRMQFIYYLMRLQQYFDTMNHILSTGQGVIMHRSVWSDIAFAKTLVDMKMMRSGVYDVIEESKKNGLYECFKPHVSIYLDMTPETIIRNAKARNVNNEVGSPFFSEECLTKMISNYKTHYLEPISTYCEVLVYDWNDNSDVVYDDIIDDITGLDLEKYGAVDKKLHDWNSMKFEYRWKKKRIMFNAYGMTMLSWAQNVRRRDLEEIWPSGEDMDGYYEALKNEPGRTYQFGYNHDMGDTFLFKTKYHYHRY